MGTIENNPVGTNAPDTAVYNLADVSAGDTITAQKFNDIAAIVNQERARRGYSAASFSFTGNIADSEVQALITQLEAADPPPRGLGYTNNPGTVSAIGSGDNTDIQHAAEVSIPTTDAEGYTSGIRDLSATILASEINSIIDKVQAAGAVCTCNCNYCTCNCNYCTCNCNYACTCNCNY